MAEKKAYNQSIGKAHVDASRKCIVNYWQKYFDGDLQLVDLTHEQLREFTIHLSKQKKHSRDKEKRKLDEPPSSRTLNTIIKTGTIALNWAY